MRDALRWIAELPAEAAGLAAVPAAVAARLAAARGTRQGAAALGDALLDALACAPIADAADDAAPPARCSSWCAGGYLTRRDTESTDVPGRKAPCPCGSGKKVKKCCGDRAMAKRPISSRWRSRAAPTRPLSLPSVPHLGSFARGGRPCA
jgi:hypothetical protein